MDQSEWMIYLCKDVLTGKRNKLIYSLLNYDFVQYTTVYEYMSILDFHRDWSLCKRQKSWRVNPFFSKISAVWTIS